MASITFLWKNRAKFPLFSMENVKAWAKRLLTLKELFVRNLNRTNYKLKGVNIDSTAEIGRIKLKGPGRKLSIGKNSFIGKNVECSLHADIKIGNNVCINDDVRLLTGSHDVLDPKWPLIKRAIVIQDYAWICTGAIILPGIVIGVGAVVGAGAVVSKNVPNGAIVVGNPATIIKNKRADNLDYNPCEFLAANLAWLKG